jgi:hypothetical protein
MIGHGYGKTVPVCGRRDGITPGNIGLKAAVQGLLCHSKGFLFGKAAGLNIGHIRENHIKAVAVPGNLAVISYTHLLFDTSFFKNLFGFFPNLYCHGREPESGGIPLFQGYCNIKRNIENFEVFL